MKKKYCIVMISLILTIFLFSGCSANDPLYIDGLTGGGGDITITLDPGIYLVSGSISDLTENSYNSIDNPFGKDVFVTSAIISITTGSTAATTLKFGLGDSATTDYTTLFDNLTADVVGTYLSTASISNGSQTTPQLWESGVGNRYLNISIKDNDATGLVASYIITVIDK